VAAPYLGDGEFQRVHDSRIDRVTKLDETLRCPFERAILAMHYRPDILDNDVGWANYLRESAYALI